MNRRMCVLSGVLAFSAHGLAQSPPSSRPSPTATPAVARQATRQVVRPVASDGRLAVRRVVLYKNGVGFFEHVGRVVGNQDVTVTFTSAQLDDALKSLTALDLGGGHVAGITFNSTAPLEQRLANVSFRLGDDGNRADFFRSVRGARLEVRTARGVVHGRVMSVDQEPPGDGKSPQPPLMLMLADDAGRVTSVRVGPDTAVRLLDRDISSSVSQYLSLLADEHRRDERRVSIATRGTGARDLYVSYVSEVPVWKSTYRLLLSGDGPTSPVLQGWAVVDNTVGEDWVDVEMALVAGAPQSFVQRLSQPHYVRRPVVGPPSDVQLEPQTHDSGTTSASLSASAGGQVAGISAERQESARVYELSAMASPPPPPAPAAMSARAVGGLDSPGFRADIGAELRNQAPAAIARAVGELFEYKLAEKVTVRKNQSALVPIVRAEVTAERVSLWNDSLGAGRPLRAVWMTNTSGLTLDGGSVSIVDGGVFAGEGTIDALVAGEKRLLSYARDLSMALDARTAPERHELVRARTENGFLVEHRESCAQRSYTVRNDDKAARALIVEHPRRDGWNLAEGQSAVESTPAVYRFRVTVPASSASTLVVREVQAVQQRVAGLGMSVDQVNAYASAQGANAAVAAALRPVAELRDAAGRADAAKVAKEQEAAAIRTEQGHVRQNMGALKGTEAEKQLLQRYVHQLDEQENRLAALGTEVAALARRASEAKATFDAALKTLAFDIASPSAKRCQ